MSEFKATPGASLASSARTVRLPGPVEVIYRDSKIGEICVGNNEIQKWIIAPNSFCREIAG
ncbi:MULTISPECIES: hypothetical protein [unclassified Streptomyces]|uniref:hypothetical protein n=1 Tax=unclassified Streptomyces TaxID=2593676 RepID=UPI000C26E9A8|nr:hypothetical protein [Streptomyces sp. CB01635]